jgi:hypothetical protein
MQSANNLSDNLSGQLKPVRWFFYSHLFYLGDHHPASFGNSSIEPDEFDPAMGHPASISTTPGLRVMRSVKTN